VKLKATYGKFKPLAKVLERVARGSVCQLIAEKLDKLASGMADAELDNLKTISDALDATALFLFLDFVWNNFRDKRTITPTNTKRTGLADPRTCAGKFSKVMQIFKKGGEIACADTLATAGRQSR